MSETHSFTTFFIEITNRTTPLTTTHPNTYPRTHVPTCPPQARLKAAVYGSTPQEFFAQYDKDGGGTMDKEEVSGFGSYFRPIIVIVSTIRVEGAPWTRKR